MLSNCATAANWRARAQFIDFHVNGGKSCAQHAWKAQSRVPVGARSILFKKRQALTFSVDVTLCCNFVVFVGHTWLVYTWEAFVVLSYIFMSVCRGSVTRPADGQHANCRNVVDDDKLLMTHDKLRTGDASSRRSFIFKRRSRHNIEWN